MNKKVLYAEVAYVLGIVILAFGTALLERANFGMSMIVAPAYLLHLKVSQTYTWFTFGVAEYTLQAVLLLMAMLIWRKFKPMYLFSFVTAVFYGIVLDQMMKIAALLPGDGISGRVILYILGVPVCSLGVSLLFHTYFAPEAYELLVKEISARYGTDINKTKTAYDCTSCLVSVLLSFAFFGIGHFEGVKWGTVICALVNGFLIGNCSRIIDQIFKVDDALPLKKYFL